MKSRLDNELFKRGLVNSRSQAENYIKLGVVYVNKKPVTKAGFFVASSDDILIKQTEQYVSRAGLKLASVTKKLNLDFNNKVVLDVGSSTGGFTDYSLKHGAKKVIAVDVGTKQLHPSLINNSKIELYEQTNILDVYLKNNYPVDTLSTKYQILNAAPDIVLIDVSFVSIKEILPHIKTLSTKFTKIVAMVKPQFEAGSRQKNHGIIKNDLMRREILKEFEQWAKTKFVVINKADSDIAGAKGNRERFYLLKKL